jgi:hypothetical protein
MEEKKTYARELDNSGNIEGITKAILAQRGLDMPGRMG